MTANAGSENKALYFREGFDGYLLKPVSGAQLEEELLRLLPKNFIRQLNAEGTVGMIEAPILEHRKKVPVMISTDTTSDLPDYLIDGNLAAVMPYRVKTEGGEFLDGVETETDGILAYMKAVSYTHLDVYKRQALDRGRIFKLFSQDADA